MMSLPTQGKAKKRPQNEEAGPEDNDENRKVSRLSSPEGSHSPLTPLSRTANTAPVNTVEELVLKSVKEGHGGSCLRAAARKNRMDVFKELMKYAESELDVNEVDEKKRTALMIACQSGSEDVVQRMLAEPRFDPNLTDSDLNSCLNYAVRNNKLKILELLLADQRLRIAIDSKNKDGITPFIMACQDGFDDAAKRLLESKDIDVNCADINGDTPLLHAVMRGFGGIVNILLEIPNIEVNKSNDNGDTALMCAANERHEKIVEQLLQCKDINVNSSNIDLYTSLMCACDKGSEKIVQLLLSHPEIDINLKDKESGDTALVWAADKSHIEVVQMLVERKDLEPSSQNMKAVISLLTGRAINSPSDICYAVSKAVDNRKPSLGLWLLKQSLKEIENQGNLIEHILVQAIQEGDKDIVDYLVKHSSVNVNAEDRNETILILAANSDSTGAVDMVKALVSRKECNVNTRGSNGNTALLRACDNGNEEVVKVLLSHPKVDVNTAGEDLQTPLICAARKGLTASVELLLQRGGINVNHRGTDQHPIRGKSALIWAAEEGHHAVARLLVKHKEVDVNLQDEDGYTALIWAADNGHLETVTELLKHPGIDINLVDLDGHSALIWAADRGHTEIVAHLLSCQNLEVNVRDKDGFSPLICAANMGHCDVVQLLLQDERTDDDQNNTALMSAVKKLNEKMEPEMKKDVEKICRSLLNHPKADLEIKKNGKTALQLIKSKKQKYEIFGK